ncbi:hypothetical protein APHAL10511_002926 [Amanita phalloides]|nr:hypothetical protein APHAL10511_002926 [Amanita phalloides]
MFEERKGKVKADHVDPRRRYHPQTQQAPRRKTFLPPVPEWNGSEGKEAEVKAAEKDVDDIIKKREAKGGKLMSLKG